MSRPPSEAGLKATAAGLRGRVLTRVLDVRDAAGRLRFADEVREWLPAPLATVFDNAGVAMSGLAGMPHQSAYCAAKFAVRGFTESLRHELRGTGVRAITVHPGGITTTIARNARVRRDPEGRGRTKDEMAAQFEAMTMTSPERAAEIIHTGVDRGKARILVGPDAHLFDALTRVTPTHYYAVLSRLRNRMRARQTEAAK